MARDLEYDGYWEGNVCYSCDCRGCGKTVKMRFDSEEEAKDYAGQRELLKRQGWLSTKVNGNWHDFCSETCRNKYIRDNTI